MSRHGGEYREEVTRSVAIPIPRQVDSGDVSHRRNPVTDGTFALSPPSDGGYTRSGTTIDENKAGGDEEGSNSDIDDGAHDNRSLGDCADWTHHGSDTSDVGWSMEDEIKADNDSYRRGRRASTGSTFDDPNFDYGDESEWENWRLSTGSRGSTGAVINIGGGGISIGGGGGRDGEAGWQYTERLRDDGGGGSRGLGADEDFAFGRSMEEPGSEFLHVDAIHRKAEERTTRLTKARRAEGGGSNSNNLTGGTPRSGGGAGGGFGGGRKSTRRGSWAEGGSSKGGGGAKDSGGVGGGDRKSGKQTSTRRAAEMEELYMKEAANDGKGNHKGNDRGRGAQSTKKSPSGVDAALTRKKADRKRSLEIKKSISTKDWRLDAGVELWQTYVHESSECLLKDTVTDEEANKSELEPLSDAAPSGLNTPTLALSPTSRAKSRRQEEGEEEIERIQSRLKRDKAGCPPEVGVREAQKLLARALRLGGKQVALHGLVLRYPQNVTALLADAAEALEHGLLRRRQPRNGDRTAAAPAWATTWSHVQIMDLSRNRLEGIEPLLQVPISTAGTTTTTATASTNRQRSLDGQNQGRGGGEAKAEHMYPLAGLLELRLNGNEMHALPPKMDVTLPALEKLELYGNRIEGLRMPERPLLRLKYLNLGYNNLLGLPAEACTIMPNLEELLLPNNLLEWLPREITGLRYLKRLDVSRNPLASPPVEVAARGLESVKRYFLDIESQDKTEDGHLEAPNQVKVIFIGHADAGKSELIKALQAGGGGGTSSSTKSSGTPSNNSPSSSVLPSSSLLSTDNYPARSSNEATKAVWSSTTPVNSTTGGGAFNKGSEKATTTIVTPSYLDKTRGWGPGIPSPPPKHAGPLGFPSASVVTSSPTNIHGTGTATSRSPKPVLAKEDVGPTVTPAHGNVTPPRDNVAPHHGNVSPPRRRWETVHNMNHSDGFGSAAKKAVSATTRAAAAVDGRRHSTGNTSRIRGAHVSSCSTTPSTTDSQDAVAMAIRTWTPTVKLRKRLSGDVVNGGHGPDGRGVAEAGGDAKTPSVSGEGGGEGGRDEGITLKLWDFGGKEEFHSVHGLFFSGRALYMIVFDLQHVERDDIDKRVQFWLDCVQTRVPGAYIQLVGTHADCMPQGEAKARGEKVLKQLLQNEENIVRGLSWPGGSQTARGLRHERSRPRIEPVVLAVSNRTMQGFGALRQHILALTGDAKKFPPTRLPPLWGEADRLIKLRRAEGRNIMSLKDLVSSLRNGSVEGDPAELGGQGWENSRNTVVSTLNWLNDTSEVVYFNKPGLDEFVFMHPTHLMEAIKLIVRRDLAGRVGALVEDHQVRKHLQGARSAPEPTTPVPSPGTPASNSDYPPLTPTHSFSEIPKPRATSGGYLAAAASAVSGIRGGDKTKTSPGGGPPPSNVSTGVIGLKSGASPAAARASGPSNRGQKKQNSRGSRRSANSADKTTCAGSKSRGSSGSTPPKDSLAAIEVGAVGSSQGDRKKADATGTTPPIRPKSKPASMYSSALGSAERIDFKTTSLSAKDEVHFGSGLLSRAVVEALLEPLAELRWDAEARAFLIRLLQESCVLVKVANRKSSENTGSVPRVPKSQSMDETIRAGFPLEKESGVKYFVPCLLERSRIEWDYSWVSKVHCGRRWRFYRFVPPSLMSALISRFYDMGTAGSAQLCKDGIYIRVPLATRGGRSGRRPEAEVYLRLHRGRAETSLALNAARLELWARAAASYREPFMRALEAFVKVVDTTLDEFPGLMVHRRVPCPACMERKPGYPNAWGELPLSVVEENRSSPWDLPNCANNCRLQDLQKRLLFVGEIPDGVDDEPWEGINAHHRRHTVWDSPLQELGALDADRLGGGGLHGRGGRGGLGVPRVEALYPAVCPIAIYNCQTQSAKAHATAFVVDAEKGLLLTAAHTFLEVARNLDKQRDEWRYYDGCTPNTCIILIGMLQPPYTYDAQWEYVADAWQHPTLVREKMYDEIGWKRDHPVLLQIRLRFKGISTRVLSNLPFEGLTSDWKASKTPRDRESDGKSQGKGKGRGPGLAALKLGESRVLHRPEDEADHLTVFQMALFEVLQRPGSEVCMTMTVFPQELLTLVAWPEHIAPNFSSICVTHGPVARNMVAQDVIEVLLSNHVGASGGPVLSKRGEVVGILSQGSAVSAYVMGISTAKTIMRAGPKQLEKIYSIRPLVAPDWRNSPSSAVGQCQDEPPQQQQQRQQQQN